MAAVLIAGVALALALAACSDSDSDDDGSSEGQGEATATMDNQDEATPDHDDEADGHDDEAEDHDDSPEAHAELEDAPKDAEFAVDMTSFAFDPGRIEVNAGDVVEIVFENQEPVIHDFTIEHIDADVHVAGGGEHEHLESAAEADMHIALTEPGTGTLLFRAHEPGEYAFYCTVPGHRQGGMEGTLVVN